MTYLYLFFQLKIKQVAQQLDTNFRVQGLISLFICYLGTRYQFFKKDKKPGKVQPQPHHQQHSGHFGTEIEFVFLSKKKKKKHFWQGQGGMF